MALIFYVGPHHLGRMLEMAVEVLGPERRAAIARELTKKFEEVRRGTLGELRDEPGVVRGEIVLIVTGNSGHPQSSEEDVSATLASLMAEGLSSARVAKELTRRTGIERSEAYRLAVEARRDAAGEDLD